MSTDVAFDFLVNPSLDPPQFPIIQSKYRMLLQEIDVLLNTSSTEVLNSWTGWPNIKDYIFSTNISESTLSSTLNSLIKSQCPSSDGIDVSCDVQFIEGELSDIGVITVYIKKDGVVTDTKQYYVG